MPILRKHLITNAINWLAAIFCLVGSTKLAAAAHTVSDYVTRVHQDFNNTDELEIAVWLHRDEFVDKKELIISRLIQKQPDTVYGHFLMTQLQVRKYLAEPLNVYQLKVASDLAQQTIELGPQKDYGYVAVAQILDLMGQSGNAQKILDMAEPTVKQKTWRLSYLKGVLQAGRNQQDVALKNFAKALEFEDAAKDLIYLSMINALQDKKEGQDLVEALLEYEVQYKSRLFTFAVANALADQGKFKEAHTKYHEVYTADAQNFEAVVNDIDALEKMRNINAAYDLAKKTIATYETKLPMNLVASLHRQLGMFAVKKHLNSEAEKHVVAALDYTDNKFQVLASVTEEYRKQKMYKELLSLLDKLNASNPGYALQYAIKGETLSENLQKHKEAVEAFGDAIALDPSRGEFYNGMGLAHFRMNEFKKALISFNAATKLDPKDSVARYNEACAFARMGDSAKALTALRTAVTLDPRLKDQAKTDSDLASIQNKPEFAVIMQSTEKQVSSVSAQPPRMQTPSNDIIMIND